MRVVFVENNDSFSWNVVDLLPFTRSEIVMVHGARGLDLSGADALVIGPGPMDPERAGLIELVLDAATRNLPTLGICLGHQAIGAAFGARIVRGPPVHGRTSRVTFSAPRLFSNVTMDAMRYHSLSVAAVVPPLRVVATTEEGVTMAVEHHELPMGGLQFHPDSYATPMGPALVESFFRRVLA